jgi:hypothetical protein
MPLSSLTPLLVWSLCFYLPTPPIILLIFVPAFIIVFILLIVRGPWFTPQLRLYLHTSSHTVIHTVVNRIGIHTYISIRALN